MEYRGWTNYETWAVNNWYGPYISELGSSVSLSATEVRDLVEAQVTVGLETSSLKADFVRNCLTRVDWEELAELYQPEPFLYDEL